MKSHNGEIEVFLCPEESPPPSNSGSEYAGPTDSLCLNEEYLIKEEPSEGDTSRELMLSESTSLSPIDGGKIQDSNLATGLYFGLIVISCLVHTAHLFLILNHI